METYRKTTLESILVIKPSKRRREEAEEDIEVFEDDDGGKYAKLKEEDVAFLKALQERRIGAKADADVQEMRERIDAFNTFFAQRKHANLKELEQYWRGEKHGKFVLCFQELYANTNLFNELLKNRFHEFLDLSLYKEGRSCKCFTNIRFSDDFSCMQFCFRKLVRTPCVLTEDLRETFDACVNVEMESIMRENGLKRDQFPLMALFQVQSDLTERLFAAFEEITNHDVQLFRFGGALDGKNLDFRHLEARVRAWIGSDRDMFKGISAVKCMGAEYSKGFRWVMSK